MAKRCDRQALVFSSHLSTFVMTINLPSEFGVPFTSFDELTVPRTADAVAKRVVDYVLG